MRYGDAYWRTLGDFEAGSVLNHWPRKTVTESDNNLFCLLTMNHHPLHLDSEFARRSQHGRILVVGTYVLSLIVGMTVPDVSGAAIANLEYEKVEHIGPVFVGDTLHARTRILEVRASRSKPDRGVVYVETEAFNQDDRCVLRFRRRVLIPTNLSQVAVTGDLDEQTL
jgi:acyl dehydratase